MKDFYGDMLELIDEAEKYILKNIHIGMRLEGMYRVDVPEIAVAAFREAIINAFCHRDWRDPESIRVAIYKDRMEIRSPGTLYGNLTIERIRQGNVSRRCNPLIANLLRRVNLVEAWGRGMPKIFGNSPDASFEELAGLFIARFKRQSYAVEQSPTPEVTPHVTTQVEQLIRVLDTELLRQEILGLLGLKSRKHLAQAYLKPALEAGLIEMTQPESPRSPTQKYRLTPQGQQLALTLKN